MKKWLSAGLLACIGIGSGVLAQTGKPKLVIGIVVDQMRYDYLQTFQHLYGPDGFNRLLKGQVFHNVNYNYIPTFTGPGHASIYTGSTPAIHGIAGNDWYDRTRGKEVYCTDDDSVLTVGNPKESVSMSPKNLLVPTMTDQFKSRPGSGKVIAVALKDRGAILPGGKKADAVYWYDGKTGNFVSSTYYTKALPAWVTDFNTEKRWDGYLNETWNLSLPVATYRGVPDKTTLEEPFKGTAAAVFPYNLKEIRKEYSPVLINSTPYGNTLTLDFVKAAIKNEQLGADEVTDFLAVSFSSTDYVGHRFGPQSLELMDTYARFDRELATFFKEIDQTIGWDNVLVFLTADHGAADIPGFTETGGYYDMPDLAKRLGVKFTAKYGVNLIRYEENDQLYIDKAAAQSKKVSMQQVYADVLEWSREPWLLGAFMPDENETCDLPGEICSRIRQGFARGRSGDIWLLARPNWLPAYLRKGGTTHGSPYVYDTHVPFVVAGSGLKQGDRYEALNITDVAPSISMFLGLPMPPGTTGKPVSLK